jgi:hypothetical protein
MFDKVAIKKFHENPDGAGVRNRAITFLHIFAPPPGTTDDIWTAAVGNELALLMVSPRKGS